MSITNIDKFIEEAYENFRPYYNEHFTKGYAVAGAHFGDEGKGKIVDALASQLKKQKYNIINYRGQAAETQVIQ